MTLLFVALANKNGVTSAKPPNIIVRGQPSVIMVPKKTKVGQPPEPVPFTTPLTNTQTIQVLFNNQTYKLRTNNWKFNSTNLTNHGTITNSVDINKTQ
jgi:hypothetical protein